MTLRAVVSVKARYIKRPIGSPLEPMGPRSPAAPGRQSTSFEPTPPAPSARSHGFGSSPVSVSASAMARSLRLVSWLARTSSRKARSAGRARWLVDLELTTERRSRKRTSTAFSNSIHKFFNVYSQVVMCPLILGVAGDFRHRALPGALRASPPPRSRR